MFKEAVLVIHGFMGDLTEVEYLCNHIRLNTNIDAYSFTLPGHDKLILKDVKYEDWINESQKRIDELKSKYNTIYIIGHSMGAVIASYLATKNDIKKIVLVSPAFMYLNVIETVDNRKNIVDKFKNTKDNRQKYGEIAQKVFKISLPTMIEFRKLIKHCYDVPKDIDCSVLIMHGLKDGWVPLKSSKYVYDSIQSKNKYLKIVDDADHGILYSNKKEEVAQYISNYLKGGLIWTIAKDLKI